MEQIVDLNLTKIPEGMVDDEKILDPDYIEQRVSKAPRPSIEWSQKDCSSIFDIFLSILANTNAWLKSNDIKTIKIKVGARDDSTRPVGRKSDGYNS